MLQTVDFALILTFPGLTHRSLLCAQIIVIYIYTLFSVRHYLYTLQLAFLCRGYQKHKKDIIYPVVLYDEENGC